jgi:5-hydroxyisourate hydrolase-like protein (transthyretin family)
MAKKQETPKDIWQLSKHILDIATGEKPKPKVKKSLKKIVDKK